MNVLVACEFSGVVRDAFLKQGAYAISCDILENTTGGPSYQGNVFDIINLDWDLIIAHPPCQYLSNSGVRWLYNKDKTLNEARWKDMRQACKFFNSIISNKCLKICIENPIMHGHGMKLLEEPYTQIVHPWQHGHEEKKPTCLWLKGLPKLKPTNIVDKGVSKIHLMPPSKDRSKKRSITYKGIAEAMATQWIEG